MTLRERILSVYRGETPDCVPFMLDLSHWFYHRRGQPWDLSRAYDQPERELIDEHHRLDVGFYMPNLGSFYETHHVDGVRAEVVKVHENGAPTIIWRYHTPEGTIERRRVWEESTYSWPVSHWGVSTEKDIRILGRALGARRWAPRWDRYKQWVDHVGDGGVVYLGAGYSAMGHLLNYWMGVGETMYAIADYPDAVREAVESGNAAGLELINLLAESPAEVVVLGDNFSSDIQSPGFFAQWSRDYYAEAIRRLHAAGKYVAVHIDGRLRGALRMFAEIGADCADAITPAPMGDLTSLECRREAGPEMVLSGGVPPNLWLPDVDISVFKRSALDWLSLRRESPRLIANAGDQVPPGAEESRIKLMGELVREHGGC